MQKRFSILIGFLIFLTFDLMLLGAGVRAMDAGLTCPDWPMCFGRVIPEYHLGVYLEFIHRAVAGVLAMIFFGAFVYALIKKELRHVRWTMTISFLLLLSQVIMGGLTVLKLLQPGIVTLHLSLAGAFLISLVILQWQIKPQEVSTQHLPSRLQLYSLIGFAMVCGQIILGGWTASNYAGAVCLDFPTCNGQWFPTWTGPIGIQVFHRLGAYALAAFLIYLFVQTLIWYKKGLVSAREKQLTAQCFVLVLSQMMVGVLNLRFMIPAWLTVIHLGVALYLMLTLLRLNLRIYFSKSGC